jgi:hypothetical protein
MRSSPAEQPVNRAVALALENFCMLEQTGIVAQKISLGANLLRRFF